MKAANNDALLLPEGYSGKILTGDFSDTLKRHVFGCIRIFSLLERTGTPVLLYIAAWKEKDKNLWYEYAAQRLLELMGCSFPELAHTFKTGVEDHRTYRYTESKSIEKEVLARNHLDGRRDDLRRSGLKTGAIEAVYKLLPRAGDAIWLKDQAIIQSFSQDRLCLSLGNLTVVTKEMKAEEAREAMVEKLQEALSNVKTLQGLLPICASCKKIRDDQGYWNQIESYLETHSELSFSHSVCPECFQKLYPEFKQNP